MTHCPKCANTILEHCEGFSTGYEKGDRYTYTRCVLCGFVEHHLTPVERSQQVKMRAMRLEPLDINVHNTRAFPRVLKVAHLVK